MEPSRVQISHASSKASIELFAYPWDIVDRGVEPFVEECCELGVRVLHVTTLYHSGKFFLPRNSTNRVYFPEPGCLYVALPQSAFAEGFAPGVSKLANSGWLDTLVKAAATAGIHLAAWTVFHHSSALGAKHPEA